MNSNSKPFFAAVLAAVAICFAPPIGRVVAAAAPAAPADEQVVVQADRAFQDALAKKDSAAVGKLLDAKFAWTDTQGATHEKMDSLKMLDAMAADTQSDADLHTLFYGELGLVSGIHHDARLMRVWVKRPAGWRLMIYLDTPIGKRAPGAGGARAGGGEEGGAGDCDNPCRTLPFKPETAADKAVITEWQKTKVDEWHPNIADWQTHIADEFMIINENSARNKPERVKVGEEAQARGAGAPGAPILSMTMADFGSAVVMISHHVPYQGGKPYYNVRVFVNRDQHWPLVWSQQTTIQSADALPPVSAKK
jgi:hypothetical protein